MNKISKVDACILATRAMLSGDYNKEKKIDNIIIRSVMEDKKHRTYSQHIELNESEKKLLAY